MLWLVQQHCRMVLVASEAAIPEVAPPESDSPPPDEPPSPSRKARSATTLPKIASIVAEAHAQERTVTSAVEREKAAQARVMVLRARAQRELTRAASVAAMNEAAERKRHAVRQLKQENDRLIGARPSAAAVHCCADALPG